MKKNSDFFKKKIIFVTNYKLTKSHHDRFDLSEFEKLNIKIEVHEVGEFINQDLDQILKKNFLTNVTKLSKYFLNELNKIKNKYPNVIKEIRGKGFLIGIQLQSDQTKFIKSLEKNYLLTIRAAENVIRVLPPLNVKKTEIDLAIKIIKKVCKNYN